jgi:hypothetical protein
LFDISFNSRLIPFEDRRDDMDQSVNWSLHVPNRPITMSKTKALKEALN